MDNLRLYIEGEHESTPRRAGLLSVASFPTVSDPHTFGGIEFLSDHCQMDLDIAGNICDPPAGTNEVQTATITGAPTGGTYTLNVYGETTAPIAYNASNATVQAALEALSAFSVGDVTVGGTATSRTFTFAGQDAAQDMPQITATNVAFTGGTTPAISTATTTPGVRTKKTYRPMVGTVKADPFTLYTLRECRAPGAIADAQKRTLEVFNNAEEKGLELAFWRLFTANGAGAVTINATATTPEVGIAQAEQWAAENFGKQATFHMRAEVASIAATRGALAVMGNRLETKLGSQVVAGGGYGTLGPNAAATVTGQSWIFVTGKPVIRRGITNVQGPFLVQSPLDNTQIVMAERTYVATYDCILGAIRVTNV